MDFYLDIALAVLFRAIKDAKVSKKYEAAFKKLFLSLARLNPEWVNEAAGWGPQQ